MLSVFKVSKFHRFKIPKLQIMESSKCQCSDVTKFRNFEVRKFQSSKVQMFQSSKVQMFQNSKVPKLQNVRLFNRKNVSELARIMRWGKKWSRQFLEVPRIRWRSWDRAGVKFPWNYRYFISGPVRVSRTESIESSVPSNSKIDPSECLYCEL